MSKETYCLRPSPKVADSTAPKALTPIVLSNRKNGITKSAFAKIPRKYRQKVMKKIMGFLEPHPCFAAALGLTCSRFYHLFKQQHPEPLNLEQFIWPSPSRRSRSLRSRSLRSRSLRLRNGFDLGTDDERSKFNRGARLHDLLSTWIDPDNKYEYMCAKAFNTSYDIRDRTNWPKDRDGEDVLGGRFLLKSTYGNLLEDKYGKLAWLMDAYYSCRYLTLGQNSFSSARILRQNLPATPCGMGGEKWFEKLIQLLSRDINVADDRFVFTHFPLRVHGKFYFLDIEKVNGVRRHVVWPCKDNGHISSRHISVVAFARLIWA